MHGEIVKKKTQEISVWKKRPGEIEKVVGNFKKKEAYNTCGSQAVTHPSTKQAQHCLTSVIGREPVYSVWYGRRHKFHCNYRHLTGTGTVLALQPNIMVNG